MSEINDLVSKLGLSVEVREHTAQVGDLVWYIDWVDGTKPEIRGPSPLYQHPLYPGLSYEGVKDTRTYVARDGSERRQGNTRTFKFVGFDDSGRHTPDFSSHEKAKAWVVDFFDREVERVDQERKALLEAKSRLEGV